MRIREREIGARNGRGEQSPKIREQTHDREKQWKTGASRYDNAGARERVPFTPSF